MARNESVSSAYEAGEARLEALLLVDRLCVDEGFDVCDSFSEASVACPVPPAVDPKPHDAAVDVQPRLPRWMVAVTAVDFDGADRFRCFCLCH